MALRKEGYSVQNTIAWKQGEIEFTSEVPGVLEKDEAGHWKFNTEAVSVLLAACMGGFLP